MHEPTFLVYGLAAGENEAWAEDLLATTCRTLADVDAVKTAAAKDGFHSFRVARFDQSARFGAKSIAY